MLRSFLLMTLLVVASGPAPAADATVLPEDVQGLSPTEWQDVDTVYLRDGARLGAYDTLLIRPPSVSFRDNWLRQQNRQRPSPQDRIRPEDVERIQEEIADDLVARFTRSLEQAGYTVTDEAGEETLELDPAIIELDVFDPNLTYRQTAPRTRIVGPQVNAGQLANQMTLRLRLVDAASGALLAVAQDELQTRKVTANIGTDITDRAANAVTFDRWAAKLVDALRASGG